MITCRIMILPLSLLSVLSWAPDAPAQAGSPHRIPLHRYDCFIDVVFGGIVAPCESDTISRRLVNTEIRLSYRHPAVLIDSFELSYTTTGDTTTYSRAVTGDRVLFDRRDPFFNRMNAAEVIYIDRIKAHSDRKRFAAPSIVKYPQ